MMTTFKQFIKEGRNSYWLKPPWEMTKQEFFNPPPIEADSGHTLLYHATKTNRLGRKIFRVGLLLSEMRGHISKEPDVIWATTRPNAYSESQPLVIFQVPDEDFHTPKHDPVVDTVAGNQARIWRDIPPKDIIALDLVYRIGKQPMGRLSKFQRKYTEMFWEDLQKGEYGEPLD